MQVLFTVRRRLSGYGFPSVEIRVEKALEMRTAPDADWHLQILQTVFVLKMTQYKGYAYIIGAGDASTDTQIQVHHLIHQARLITTHNTTGE